MKRRRAPAVGLLPALGLLLLGLTACGDDGSGPSDGVLELSIQGPADQSGPAGSILAEPLAALVSNAAGDPVRGVPVRFAVAAGASAELSDSVATSGLDGIARVEARLGGELGAYRFTASIGTGANQSVTFGAEATPPPTLTSASQDPVEAGDTITLTGTDFNVSTTGNVVYFGSARALVLRVDGTTQLQVVVPPCVAAGAVEVRVQIGSVSTNPLPLTYSATNPTLGLAPLQGITVAGTEAGNCLRLDGNGANYLLVPNFASAGTSPDAQAFRLGNQSATAQSIVAAARRRRAGVNYAQARFDRVLRGMEQRLAPLGARTAAARRAEALSASVVTDIPLAQQLNSERNFRVLSNFPTEDQPAEFETSTATLRHRGDNILLYVDVNTPDAGFTDDQIEAFGRLFDQDLYELGVATFGTESDIDDNDHVIVLLTPIVNALTDAATCESEGFVTGFFFGFDLASQSNDSNKGEIFYAFVPDPDGTFSCPHPVSRVQRLVPSTFIHELQHMISYNQHVLVRGGNTEAIWLNEGLSHIAEEVASRYYESRYPPPAGRTNPNQLFPDSSQGFILGNMFNSYDYLQNRTTVSVTTFGPGSGRVEERGAAWLFLRWLGDQADSTIFQRLVQTGLTGIANVEDKAGESFASLFGDFSIAVWTDSLVGVPREQVPQRYRFSSRNLRQLYQALFDALQPNPAVPSPFPIALTPLPYNGAVNGEMLPGTMDFFQLQTPNPSADAAIRFSTSGLSAFPPTLQAQVGIFRLP